MFRMTAAALAGCLLSHTLQRTAAPHDAMTLKEKQILSHMHLVLADDGSGRALPTIRIEGVNVQIVNGKGATYEVNGLGNLIVGYQAALGSTERSGSHNVIVGDDTDYSSYGGLSTGGGNQLLGPGCATVGTYESIARGTANAVLGGTKNEVDGLFNVAVGGQWHTIAGSSGRGHVVVGGSYATIQGYGLHHVIVGGNSHTIDRGEQNVVVGGAGNELVDSYFVGTLASNRARTFQVQVGAMVGGAENTMGSPSQIVLSSVMVGGGDNSITGGNGVTVVGGEDNSASGNWSVVTGGRMRSANGAHDWVAGALFQDF